MKQSWKHLRVGLSAIAIGALVMLGAARIARAVEPGADGACTNGCTDIHGNTVSCGPYLGGCANALGVNSPANSPNGDCQVGEQCDDGNTINGDGCDNNCSFTACGNGISTAGEECDNGAANNNINLGAGGNPCDTNCHLKSCGNGRVEGGEQCDDGDTLCDDDCDSCENGALGNCLFPGCGNGITDTGEQCDDGNTVNGDGCDTNCKFPGCGNGVIDPGEKCDDGNTVNGDGCDSNCTPTGCGNGVTTTGEACDDGNTVNGDGCDNNCTLSGCGNGITDPGEQCDDGNTVNGDKCEGNCTLPRCGNGITDPGEFCDDGNTVSEVGGCPANCQAPVCGDGITQVGEACDTGECVCDVFPTKFSFGRDCGTVDGAADCTLDGGSCVNAVASAPVVFPLCSSFCAFIPGLPLCVPGTCVLCSVTGNSNNLSGHCRDNCVNFSCGDGITDPGELCDDGLFGTTGAQSIDDIDACPNGPSAKALGLACKMANVCGDGFPLIPRASNASGAYFCNDAVPGNDGKCSNISSPQPQACDNGGGVISSGGGPLPAPKTCVGNPTKTCADDVDCTTDQGTAAPCGNGGAGGVCTPGGPYTNTEPGQCRCDCTNPRCGDGITDPNEGCDDGNTVSGDGCQANCALPKCGDGITDPGEACDAGAENGSVASNCTATCKINVCGDGSKQQAEQCDNGAANSNSGPCSLTCTINTCGDGLTMSSPGAGQIAEQCDDSNHADDDGCSEDCCLEPETAPNTIAAEEGAKQCALKHMAANTAALPNATAKKLLTNTLAKITKLENLAETQSVSTTAGRNKKCTDERRIGRLLNIYQIYMQRAQNRGKIFEPLTNEIDVERQNILSFSNLVRANLFCPQ